jgi:hypothetical protein
MLWLPGDGGGWVIVGLTHLGYLVKAANPKQAGLITISCMKHGREQAQWIGFYMVIHARTPRDVKTREK